MKYKYIGTEEQLVEHGFDKYDDLYVKPCPYINGYIYVLSSKEIVIRKLLYTLKDKPIIIEEHIQDLIDDGLVEVLS